MGLGGSSGEASGGSEASGGGGAASGRGASGREPAEPMVPDCTPPDRKCCIFCRVGTRALFPPGLKVKNFLSNYLAGFQLVSRSARRPMAFVSATVLYKFMYSSRSLSTVNSSSKLMRAGNSYSGSRSRLPNTSCTGVVHALAPQLCSVDRLSRAAYAAC